MANVEHELRGLLSDEEFKMLAHRLEKEAVKITDDSKDTHFFVVPEGMILKIVKSKDGREFISFKIGDETVGGLEEYEIPLKDGMEDTLRLFSHLGFNVNYVPQIRTNYFLENGLEISMKHTPDWGYHFEIEYMREDKALNSDEILQILMDECHALGIQPMSPNEIKEFIRGINERNNMV